MLESDSSIPEKVAALVSAFHAVCQNIGVFSSLDLAFHSWLSATDLGALKWDGHPDDAGKQVLAAAAEFVVSVDTAEQILNAVPAFVLDPLSALIGGVPWDVLTRRTLKALQHEISFLRNYSERPNFLLSMLGREGKAGFDEWQRELSEYDKELKERILDLQSLSCQTAASGSEKAAPTPEEESPLAESNGDAPRPTKAKRSIVRSTLTRYEGSHAENIYEQLLSKYREAWLKNRDVSVHIEIFAPSSFSTYDPPYDRNRYELLAEVSIPFYASREIDPSGPNSTTWGWAVMPKHDHSEDARESLKRLCDQAGAALPFSFRARLSHLCHWYMQEPATWWMALLVYLTRQSAYGSDGSYQGHGLLLRPFQLCIDAIEICRLNTDNPEFPEMNEVNEGEVVKAEVPECVITEGQEIVEIKDVETFYKKHEFDPNGVNWLDLETTVKKTGYQSSYLAKMRVREGRRFVLKLDTGEEIMMGAELKDGKMKCIAVKCDKLNNYNRKYWYKADSLKEKN